MIFILGIIDICILTGCSFSTHKDSALKEFDVDYTIFPAEKDVGIMYPYPAEVTLIAPNGRVFFPEEVLGEAAVDKLYESILEEEGLC